jgi:hypothetical protein
MKRLACFAAVLAIGCAGVVGCNKDETKTADTRTPGQKAGEAVQQGVDKTVAAGQSATQRAGEAADKAAATIAPTGATGIKGARNVFEGVVENVFDKNNFNKVASYFTKADEDRIKASKPDTADLDAAIDQFNTSWKGKYGENFGIKDNDSVFNAQFVALGTPAGTTGDSTAGAASTATVAASHGLAELPIPLVTEGGLYKIDVPDNVDGKALHDNLLTAIKDLQDKSSSWPDDKAEAYRQVSHRILMAVMDKK